MKSPLVSVVMVVCNVDRYLAEAIESVITQTFQDFEFIIVDFGSTDDSKAIARSLTEKDQRVRLYEIPHCSLVAARIASCSFARGTYIAIMDADDLSLPDRLALEVEFMEEHPEVGVVGGLTECIDAAGKVLSVRLHSLPAADQEIKLALATRCPFCQASVLIRRDAFELSGGYRESFLQAEDYDLWLRISERFQCAGLQQVVHQYRIHPHQLSIQKQRQQTLCVLAAQASASLRKKGERDYFDSPVEITPDALADLGVSKATQQSELATSFLVWSRAMCRAGAYSSALATITSMLKEDLRYAERWKVAELYLTLTQLYWRQRRPLHSCMALVRAIMVYPVVAGRPLKRLCGRLGLPLLRSPAALLQVNRWRRVMGLPDDSKR